MGNGNPNSEWVVDDDKIQNDYSSSRIVDVKSPISFLHLGVVLFVCKLVCLMFVFQWNGMDELVSVMEWVPSCIVDGLYGECKSWH
jgi:hypothetical protein